MTPDMQTVLWMTAVGSAALFGSIGGLVLLMYLLTASWLFPKNERAAIRARRRIRVGRFRSGSPSELPALIDLAEESEVDAAERERRIKAVALAAAIACAETAEATWLPAITVSSDWRLLRRAHRHARQQPRRRNSA